MGDEPVTDLMRRLDRSESFVRSPRLYRAVRRPWRAARVLLHRLVRPMGPAEVEATLFTGQRMYVHLPEPVSAHLYLYDYFEAPLSRALLSILKPGMTFVDVGAHLGYYSVLAHSLVQPGGRVFAFEPAPATFKHLKRNVGGSPGVWVENAAVHSHHTSVTIHDFGVRYSAFNTLLDVARTSTNGRPLAAVSRWDVKAVALDDYFAGQSRLPNFVKIDAESMELHILKGMRGLLRAGQPIVSLEVGDCSVPGAPLSRETVQFLLGEGYLAYEVATGGPWVPHIPRSTYAYENLLFVPVAKAHAFGTEMASVHAG